MGYTRARRVLVGAGAVLLFLVAAFMYSRGVDRVEVAATLLFIPVFLGFAFWNAWGGLAAAGAAALAYAALRYPAIRAVGADRFAGLIVSRAVAYLLFGAIGGWANRQFAMSLSKLELYDQIDDATGLYNARYFLEDTDLELARSKRYETLFSVAVVDIPRRALEPLSPRQRAAALRELGRMLKAGIRTVDRAAHGEDGDRHRLAVVLPETGAEGARIFVDRFASRLAQQLQQRGAALKPEDVARLSLTVPGDEERLRELREEFARIDRGERPEEREEVAAATGERRGA